VPVAAPRSLTQNRIKVLREAKARRRPVLLSSVPLPEGNDDPHARKPGRRTLKLANPRLGTDASAAFAIIFPVAGSDVAIVEQAVVVDSPASDLPVRAFPWPLPDGQPV